MKKIFIWAMGFLFVLTSQVTAATWKIDTDHSSANFTIKHMAISKVSGSFSNVSGQVELHDSGKNPFSIEIVIAAESINTGVEKRDTHLKSPDFFDINTYPSLHFVSKEVSRIDQGEYKVVGDLTMHGVTKEVTVSLLGLEDKVKDPWGNLRIGAQITGEINRKDFGIVYNNVLDNGSLLIGDTANVSVDLEFIKK